VASETDEEEALEFDLDVLADVVVVKNEVPLGV
jgi:hypothetical protein